MSARASLCPRATSTAATSVADSGANRSCGQRERTVGSSRSGIEVTRMNTEPAGGSSSTFKQRVLRGELEAVRLIDNRHAAAAFERPVSGTIDQIADRIDLDVALVVRLDEEDVGVNAARDALTRGTRSARIDARLTPRIRQLARRWVEAVERLRCRERGKPLADARRPREDQAGRQPLFRNRARQQGDQRAMSDDVAEWHERESGRIVSPQAIAVRWRPVVPPR